MLLSTDGLQRPGDREQVREPGHGDAQVVPRPGGPLRCQRNPVPAPDVDGGQRAGHRVEAGREHDGVELVLGRGRAEAGRRELDQRRLAQVDQVHVGPVERLVVAGVQAHPLGADRERARAQRLGHLGVVDDRADLVPDELGGGLVGGRVDQDVDVGADQRGQLTPVPGRLVPAGALLRRRGEPRIRSAPGRGCPRRDVRCASRQSR